MTGTQKQTLVLAADRRCRNFSQLERQVGAKHGANDVQRTRLLFNHLALRLMKDIRLWDESMTNHAGKPEPAEGSSTMAALGHPSLPSSNPGGQQAGHRRQSCTGLCVLITACCCG